MRIDSVSNQAKHMVERLYHYAMDERGFRPDQAFEYVRDEVEGLMRKGTLGSNAILQTAIFIEGYRRGLNLSKDDDDEAREALEILEDAYRRCSDEELISAGVESDELDSVKENMVTVSSIFLR